MHENEIATITFDIAFHIHQQLGPGLLESVYEAVMLHASEVYMLKIKYPSQSCGMANDLMSAFVQI